jgi:kynureninase
MDPLLVWRKEFPILDSTVYLISHSLGAMPMRVKESLQEYTETWMRRGIRAWEEGWWDMPVTTGDLIGRIIGAGPGEVVMHPNVSTCIALVLSCFEWTGRRNKIVCESLAFPSTLYLYYAQQRLGARVVPVESDDGITIPLERMLAAIDEETQLVSVSHVLYRSSFLQDLEAITQRAHDVGAYILADLYQSVGTVPVDVGRMGLDFATGGSVKWLCGGPGAAYLYVRRDLWPRLEPRLTGWMAHRHPFAFEAGPIRYADTAFRFLTGTPHLPALYAARPGYEIIATIGVEAIRAKSLRQTTRLIELAEEAGFRIASPRDGTVRGGTVVLDVPQGEAVTRELIRRNILVDYRPGAGIRLGPHFYTTDEELEAGIREIQTILRTRAYERSGALSDPSSR